MHEVARIGYSDWLEDQFDKPISFHQPMFDERVRLGEDENSNTRRHVWWQQVMEADDQLRQRVAYALSEILVISDANNNVNGNPQAFLNYYDLLLTHSFGNYRDLLLDVSLHPLMGVYLSHLRNERSDPSRGRFPDENYAREIMQLFSIGLFELNGDGTLKLDGSGTPIATYTNEGITELAKVFTGLGFASADPDFRRGEENWLRPMRMYEEYHEPGPKFLIKGLYLPPGQTGMQDIEDAVDNLFNHSNVGPFITRRLIQRMVTSNPSPAYIERVSDVFNDNGQGVRGDLKAVVQAILTDPEARDWPRRNNIDRGRLRESYLRRVHLAKAFDARSPAGMFPLEDGNAVTTFGQRPLSSPTVFNFFLPDYQPPGEIQQADLVAPEFQVLNAVTTISSANELQTQVERVMNNEGNDFYEVALDFSDEIALAWNSRALVDRLDLLMTNGTMSLRTRQVILDAVDQIDDPEDRVHMAVYLLAVSPEYAVLK
ncbi:hypothetical protein ABI59_04475 [Acidobacteria bacterium Mor1]|nr:hypothetical protein ABI59_04475 [Acidobacteria bacterium Mor1]